MQQGFKIIGISTHTTNMNNQSMEDLGNLWKKFYTENIFRKIPNKISEDILSVYTDYKSDYKDEYTSIIGVSVSSLDEIPNGMVGREFPSEKFQKFTAKGAMPEAVGNIWTEIWNKDKELNRKYSYDFEVYGEKSQKPSNAEVDIYISVK